MSIYHKSFSYLGKNSLEDFNMNLVSLNPDNGSVDSYLGMDCVFSDKYDGTMRNDYPSKYNSVLQGDITLVKGDFSLLTLNEVREINKWLSGKKTSTWIDLRNEDDEIDYSILGKFTKIEQYKMDGRTIGITATFESVSPWAYSTLQTETINVNNTTMTTINNLTDELYSYIYPKVVFTNTGNVVENVSDFFSIYNDGTDITTKVINISANEVITMDSNQIIYSDNTAKMYKDDFNLNWFRLTPGYNNLTIKGVGTLVISYRYPMKVGNFSVDI